MHVERMLDLADRIEQLEPRQFDMGTWGHDGYRYVRPDEIAGRGTRHPFCGCAAMWTLAFYGKTGQYHTHSDVELAATSLLDLTSREASKLFYAPNGRENVARQIRTMVAEYRVKRDVTFRDPMIAELPVSLTQALRCPAPVREFEPA
jgi:hypothetical protein